MRIHANVEKRKTAPRRRGLVHSCYAVSVPLVLLVSLISGCGSEGHRTSPPESPAATAAQESAPVTPTAATPTPTPKKPAGATPTIAATETVPLDGRDGRDLALDKFRPQPKLKVGEHLLRRAKFPVVDVHMHPRIRRFEDRLDDLIRLMDEQNIAVSVSLDGQLGDLLQDHMDLLWKQHRDRFVIYTNIDWRGTGDEADPATWDCHRDDFASRTARLLEQAESVGASGLKLFKQFGLGYRNPDGSLIKIDDPRWDPIWEACGRLGLVVIMHTADPAAFFEPINETNERWEELHRHPDWSFYGPEWPSRDELLAARNRVVERHPNTTFIGAHVANNAEDLGAVGRWLDKYPNFYVEISARIAELGRQPYTAREFFLKYADRIMFGSDGPRAPERMWLHWRFLETRDEYFPYAENEFPPQGLWRIYGVDLPDEVLRKIYFENASWLIPGVRERVEKYRASTPQIR